MRTAKIGPCRVVTSRTHVRGDATCQTTASDVHHCTSHQHAPSSILAAAPPQEALVPKPARMGIKHLYQLIQEHAPEAVKTGEIKNQFGRKVAIVRMRGWPTRSFDAH